MWSKTARLLMVHVKLKGHRGIVIPVPLYVVDEFFEALEDLAWVAEIALKFVPIPREDSARIDLSWIKRISPRGIISGSHILITDLRRHRGLDVVEVETGDVRVKVHLR